MFVMDSLCLFCGKEVKDEFKSKRKAMLKIKIRIDEAVLDILSKNYFPLVQTTLLVSAYAQAAALIKAIMHHK